MLNNSINIKKVKSNLIEMIQGDEDSYLKACAIHMLKDFDQIELAWKKVMGEQEVSLEAMNQAIDSVVDPMTQKISSKLKGCLKQ